MEDIKSVVTSDGLIIKYLFDKLNLGYNISINQEEVDYLISLLNKNGYDIENLGIDEIYKLHLDKLNTNCNHIYLKDDKIYPTHSFGELDLALTHFTYLDAENSDNITNIFIDALKDKQKRTINIKCDVKDETLDVSTKAVDLYLDMMASKKDLKGIKNLRDSLIKDISSLLTVDETLRISTLHTFPLAKSNYLAITRPFEKELVDIKDDIDISFPKKRLTIYDDKKGKCYYFKDKNEE